MDRNYYYRVLGLQPGATNQQIRTAFENRLERLSSPDYADDPEYVAKKISQVKFAYSVLMGSAAPLTKAQRKNNYECYKDDIEDNRDSDHVKHMRKAGRSRNVDAQDAFGSVKQKMQGVFKEISANSEIEIPKGMGKLLFVAAIAIIPILFTALGNVVVNPLIQAEPEYSISVEAEDDEYIKDNYEAVSRIMNRDMEYDFWTYLLYPDVDIDAEDIEWELSDETQSLLWGLNSELAYAMDIESVPDMLTYITGDDEAYWNNSDQLISYYIVDLMGAPGFSDIAGMQNTYSGEVILTYADYMEFLIMTAEIQTDEICSIPAVDYYD